MEGMRVLTRKKKPHSRPRRRLGRTGATHSHLAHAPADFGDGGAEGGSPVDPIGA